MLRPLNLPAALSALGEEAGRNVLSATRSCGCAVLVGGRRLQLCQQPLSASLLLDSATYPCSRSFATASAPLLTGNVHLAVSSRVGTDPSAAESGPAPRPSEGSTQLDRSKLVVFESLLSVTHDAATARLLVHRAIAPLRHRPRSILGPAASDGADAGAPLLTPTEQGQLQKAADLIENQIKAVVSSLQAAQKTAASACASATGPASADGQTLPSLLPCLRSACDEILALCQAFSNLCPGVACELITECSRALHAVVEAMEPTPSLQQALAAANGKGPAVWRPVLLRCVEDLHNGGERILNPNHKLFQKALRERDPALEAEEKRRLHDAVGARAMVLHTVTRGWGTVILAHRLKGQMAVAQARHSRSQSQSQASAAAADAASAKRQGSPKASSILLSGAPSPSPSPADPDAAAPMEALRQSLRVWALAALASQGYSLWRVVAMGCGFEGRDHVKKGGDAEAGEERAEAASSNGTGSGDSLESLGIRLQSPQDLLTATAPLLPQWLWRQLQDSLGIAPLIFPLAKIQGHGGSTSHTLGARAAALRAQAHHYFASSATDADACDSSAMAMQVELGGPLHSFPSQHKNQRLQRRSSGGGNHKRGNSSASKPSAREAVVDGCWALTEPHEELSRLKTGNAAVARALQMVGDKTYGLAAAHTEDHHHHLFDRWLASLDSTQPSGSHSLDTDGLESPGSFLLELEEQRDDGAAPLDAAAAVGRRDYRLHHHKPARLTLAGSLPFDIPIQCYDRYDWVTTGAAAGAGAALQHEGRHGGQTTKTRDRNAKKNAGMSDELAFHRSGRVNSPRLDFTLPSSPSPAVVWASYFEYVEQQLQQAARRAPKYLAPIPLTYQAMLLALYLHASRETARANHAAAAIGPAAHTHDGRVKIPAADDPSSSGSTYSCHEVDDWRAKRIVSAIRFPGAGAASNPADGLSFIRDAALLPFRLRKSKSYQLQKPQSAGPASPDSTSPHGGLESERAAVSDSFSTAATASAMATAPLRPPPSILPPDDTLVARLLLELAARCTSRLPSEQPAHWFDYAGYAATITNARSAHAAAAAAAAATSASSSSPSGSASATSRTSPELPRLHEFRFLRNARAALSLPMQPSHQTRLPPLDPSRLFGLLHQVESFVPADELVTRLLPPLFAAENEDEEAVETARLLVSQREANGDAGARALKRPLGAEVDLSALGGPLLASSSLTGGRRGGPRRSHLLDQRACERFAASSADTASSSATPASRGLLLLPTMDENDRHMPGENEELPAAATTSQSPPGGKHEAPAPVEAIRALLASVGVHLPSWFRLRQAQFGSLYYIHTRADDALRAIRVLSEASHLYATDTAERVARAEALVASPTASAADGPDGAAAQAVMAHARAVQEALERCADVMDTRAGSVVALIERCAGLNLLPAVLCARLKASFLNAVAYAGPQVTLLPEDMQEVGLTTFALPPSPAEEQHSFVSLDSAFDSQKSKGNDNSGKRPPRRR